MVGRTSIGGLLLDEAEGWDLSLHDGVIAARYRTDPGLLRITTIAVDTLPSPVTHDVCLSHAAKMVELADPTPSDWVTLSGVTGPYGSANFDKGPDRVYVWYCCRAPGVILGTYTCPIDLSRTLASRGVRIQCNNMITSALFDRRTWGGDDDITRWLTALLGADDAPDAERDLLR